MRDVFACVCVSVCGMCVFASGCMIVCVFVFVSVCVLLSSRYSPSVSISVNDRNHGALRMHVCALHFHTESSQMALGGEVLPAVTPCVLSIIDATSLQNVASSSEFCFVCL